LLFCVFIPSRLEDRLSGSGRESLGNEWEGGRGVRHMCCLVGERGRGRRALPDYGVCGLACKEDGNNEKTRSVLNWRLAF
jgi:hypothetical protein